MSTTGHETEAVNVRGLKATMKKGGNIGLYNECICSTAGGTAKKVTNTVPPSFSLVSGAKIIVKFTYAITVANATLQVGDNAEKPIHFMGAALKANVIKAGTSLLMSYDGTAYNVIGGAGGNEVDITYDTTNKKITKTIDRVTTEVVSAERLVTDGGAALEPEVEVGNTAPTGTPTIFVDEDEDPAAALDVYTRQQVDTKLGTKVDKVTGKDLSTNDYTDTDKDKLDALPSASEAAQSGGTALSLVTTGEKYTWNSKQDAIVSLKEIGFGFVNCSTTGSTTEKAISISGFVLKEFAHISVYFTYGFTTTGSTLNVNGTGAKPIYLYGTPIAPHKVLDHTIVQMVYDGTKWNAISIEHLGATTVSGAVDLGLPSGLLWCDHNVGAATPEAPGLYFSWGNVMGHAEGSGYDFSQATYNGTPGAALTGDIAVGDTYDAARHNMGAPWRMPTKDEFQELVDNCDSVWIEENGMPGRRFTSRIDGNSIFFPAAGHYDGTTLYYRGSRGYYWASSLYSATGGYGLVFHSSAVGPQGSSLRFYGFSIRAVQ